MFCVTAVVKQTVIIFLNHLPHVITQLSELTMYCAVNTAFVNYFDMFPNLTESLKFLIIKNRTTFKQTLPVSLNISKCDKMLLNASTDLKEFINSYTYQEEIFYLQQRHDDNTEVNTNHNFFSDNYIIDIFMLISAIISLLATTLTAYLLCAHKKLRALITSLVLHQVIEVCAEMQQTNSESRTLLYRGIILTVLSLIFVTFLHYRKSKLCKGHRFSNAVKIMIFISDVQYYIPIKLCKTAGSIYLFKISGTLKAENIKLNRNYLWDRLEIDWKEVSVTFNGNKIDLPRVAIIKL